MSITRDDIVAAARGWIGTPYRHQAALKGVGCDCLGLLRGLFRELTGSEGERPPAYTPDWAEATGRETLAEGLARHLAPIDPAEAGAGDVVLFRWKQGLPAKHAAVLTGVIGDSVGSPALAHPTRLARIAGRADASRLPLALRGPFASDAAGSREFPDVGERAPQDEGKVGRPSLARPPSMIHALQGCPVAEVPLTEWWRRRVAFAFRFPR